MFYRLHFVVVTLTSLHIEVGTFRLLLNGEHINSEQYMYISYSIFFDKTQVGAFTNNQVVL